MSKGDVHDFLRKLFSSEGGTDATVINEYGYIGKYQFGEDALVDLGYYKADGTKNRNAKGKFEYDWVGEWTGKHGVHSRSDFLNSETVQDVAAKEWITLLCKKMKHFKLQSHIGKTIKGVEISESGIIAAAHLKGYGNSKHPGVIQFFSSNGEIDPVDANKTPVSLYMKRFAGYDLGCCGSVTAVLLDKNKNPIAELGYQIKVGHKVAANGKTDANGATKKVEGLDAGANITILVSKLEGGYKEIKSFIAHEQAAFVATLRSATRMVTTQLAKHHGTAGEYKRRSEMAVQRAGNSRPSATEHKPGTKKASAPNTAQSGLTSAYSTANTGATNTEKTSATTVPKHSSQIQTSNQDKEKTLTDTGVDSELPKESGVALNTQGNAESAAQDSSVNEADSPTSDGDVGAAQPSEQSVITEVVRNEDGHPVAVARQSTSQQAQFSPSVQKLEEILVRNTAYGQKKQALSGPLAAEKSRKGEPISLYRKKEDVSLGQCYKYVKIALLASGMTKHYLGKEEAKNAGGELKKEGYRNLLDDPNHGLKNPYDAPVGAVIVYDVTDGTRWGHIEVRVRGGFASDYFSSRPRTTIVGQEGNSTMSGRNRQVTGIWIKD